MFSHSIKSICSPNIGLLIATCFLVNGCNQYKQHIAEVESAANEVEVAGQAIQSWQPEVPSEIAIDNAAAQDYVAIKKGERLLTILQSQSSLRLFLLNCKMVGKEMQQLADSAATAPVRDALRAWGDAVTSHVEELESAMLMSAASNSGDLSSSGAISSAVGAGIEGYFIGESARERYRAASEQAALAVKEYNDRYTEKFPLLNLGASPVDATAANVPISPGDRWELYEATDSAGSKWDGSILEIQLTFPAESVQSDSGVPEQQIRLTGLIRWHKNGEFRGIENFEGTYHLQDQELRILGQATTEDSNLARGLYTAKLSLPSRELYAGQWASTAEGDKSIIPGVFSARPLSPQP